MCSKVTVSVIIPVYNAEKTLERCIVSLQNQTYKDFEIILIDDGSKDSSRELCEKLALTDSRIRVFYSENKGSGNARNIGLDAANGSFIYFCDPDDWVESDLLQDCINQIYKDNSDIIIFGINNFVDRPAEGKASLTGKRVIDLNNITGDFKKDYVYLSKIAVISAVWNKFIRKDFILNNKCKFPFYSKGQDFSFMISLYNNLPAVSYLDKCLYNYVTYKNNTAVTKYNPEKYECCLKIYEELKGLFKTWNVHGEEYNNVLNKFLFAGIIDQFKNILHKDSKDSFSLRYKKIDKMMNDTFVSDFIKENENLKNINKVMYYVIKYKLTLTSMIIVRLKVLISSIR